MPVKSQLKKLLSLRRLWCLLCLPLAALFGVLAHSFPPFAEFWATRVYAVISRLFHLVTRFLPFSVMELLLALLPAGLLFALVLGILHIRRSKGQRLFAALKAFLVEPAVLASVLLLVFMTNCGINYGRYPFAQIAGLDVHASAPAELQALCEELLATANEQRARVQEGETGTMTLAHSVRDTGKTAAAAYRILHEEYDTLPADYGPPKPVLHSRVMSYMNITGIFFPFTMEANVNTDVTHYNIPFVMCHELAHLRGYMREDEANFIAYLACSKSDDPDLNYSGTLMAFINAVNALGRADSTRSRAVYENMSPAVRRDLDENNAYWKAFQTPVADVSTSVNNAYLQANGTHDGVQSYGRMVDLLLAWRRAGNNI